MEDPKISQEPEYQLVIRCLYQAIQDAIWAPPNRGAKTKSTEKLVREMLAIRRNALAWLDSDDTGEWTAVWCCSIAGMDLERIRAEVRYRPAALSRAITQRDRADKGASA